MTTPTKEEIIKEFKPDDIQKARDVLKDLCSNRGQYFRMSIPVERDDSDMVLSRVIKFAEKAALDTQTEQKKTAEPGELVKWVNELTDFLYRIAQWGNQDALEADCLGQGLPMLRDYLTAISADNAKDGGDETLRDIIDMAIITCKDVTNIGRFSKAVDPVEWVRQLQGYLEGER